MKKLLPMLLLASFAMKNSIQAQSYVDFQNAVYYTASGNTLTSSGQTLAAFDYGTASPSHPIFNDGVYFPKKDYLGNNIWLRVIHIADDPNGTGVGYFVDKTASSPFRDNGFGGWFGFLYQFEVYADATLTGIASNTLNGLFPSNVRVESIETLSAGEWLTFESLNNESTAWALNSIGTGSNPGFSPTVMYYGPGFTSEFPPDSKMINAVDLGGVNFASFAMSAESVSQFRYGYEYSYNAGYQGIRVYLGNAGLPRVRIQRTAGTSPSCSNTGVTFTATPIGWPDVPDYQWKINGSNVGSNSPTYSSSSLINGDKIVCQLTSTSVAATTSNIILQSIYTPPTIAVSISPLSNTACAGSDKIFNTTVTNGGSNPSYQWKLNGNDITGETQQTYRVSGLQAGNQISCSFTRADGICGTSTSNLVTMADLFPTINITSNIPGPICAGTNVTFTASTTNAGVSPIYQWKLNDVNVGTNSPNYSNATLVDNDVVKCEVSNGCNTFTSNSITMLVNVVPSSITINSRNNQPTTICQGGGAEFSAVSTNSGAHPTYKWKVNGIVKQTYSGFTDNTSFFSTYVSNVVLNNNDVITCEMTSQIACTLPVQSNGITMTVNPVNNTSVSIAITSGSNPDCSGGPLTFTATPINGGTAPAYEWHRIDYFPAYDNIVGTNSPTLTIQNPGHNEVYYCNMTSSTVCSNPSVARSNSITVKRPTQFYGYIGCNAGCNGSDNMSTCANATVEFYANTFNLINGFQTGNNSTSYQWKLNGNDVGTNSNTYLKTGFTDQDVITCKVTSTEPCPSPASVDLSMTVSVYDVANASFSIGSGPTTLCAGTSAYFYANPGNAGPHPTYQWKLNGNDVAVATYGYWYLTNPVAGDIVTCTMTTDAGCGTTLILPSSNSITIDNITTPSTPTISIAAAQSLISLTNTFTATITHGGNNPTYQWKKNGLDIAGATNSTYIDLALVNGDVITCSLTSDEPCASPTTVLSNALTVGYCTPPIANGSAPCSITWLTNVKLVSSVSTVDNTTGCNGLYSNFSSTNSLIAAAGETVTYSITGGSDGTYYLQRRAIYIDFNKDGDFTDAGEMVVDVALGALETTPSGSTFQLPQGLAAGSYRIRVVGSLDVDFSPCTANGGEAEDYTLTITYCTPHSPGNYTACQYFYTSNVTLGTSVNNSTGCGGFYSDYSATQIVSATAGQTITYSVSLGSLDGQLWGTNLNIYIDYNNNGSFEAGEKVVTDGNISVGNPASNNFTLPSLLPYGSYRIRVVASSGGTITPSACELDYGEAEDYTLLIPEPTYCIPVISQPCDMWLSQVTIGSITNNNAQPTVCTPGGYTDYTATLSTTAAPGSTVSFSLLGGSSISQQGQNADIFVDFNNDGDFEDDGERVAQNYGFYTYPGSAYNSSFNIPIGQPYGYYRMRVKSYSLDETYSGPCGNNSNGAVQDYRLIVNCVPNGSDVVVEGNNVDIADGDNSPSLADFTDFANVSINTSLNRTFTIKNTGTAALQITGNPTFSGGYPYYFSILNYPSSYLLQPGESTSFTVQVNMPSWAYGVALNTIVNVPTDNCDKKDYDFAINATGSCPTGGPDANLQGNGIDIPAGTGTVSTATGTDFGTVNTGSTVSHTFTVQNLGIADLNITEVRLNQFSGNNRFAVTTQPASVVPIGGSTSFTITFTPGEVVSDFTYVYVINDDCDESSYPFIIGGTGQTPPCTPHSWTSAANNGNWNDPANWCDGVVPTNSDDIIIQTGKTPYPVLNTDAEIHNIELQNGAAVTIGGNTLTINGTITGTGSLKSSSSSNLVLSGNGDAGTLYFDQSADGSSNALNSITMNKTGVSGAATLGSKAIILNTYTPTAGVLTTGGNLTVRSTATKTASVTQGSDAGGYINGDVTVERYIPDNNFRSWRLLSVPTYGSQTIAQSWQQNTLITGVGSGNGFDPGSTASMLTYNSRSNSWSGIEGTNSAISDSDAYFLYVRGDRSQLPAGGIFSTNATTLKTTGSLYQGNQQTEVLAGKYGLIGNLYPSAIDFTKLTLSTGIDNVFYLWDSKVKFNNSLGVYQYFDGDLEFKPPFSPAFSPANPGGSYTTVNTTIQSGQAFFVHNSGGSTGTVTLHENSKVASSGTPGFRPATPANSIATIYSRLLDASGSNVGDVNVVKIDAVFSNEIDGRDIEKLPNGGENFGIQRAGKIFAIEGRQPISINDTIFYNMWNMQKETYTLEFEPNNLAGSGVTALLQDSYLNSNTPVDLLSTTRVNFTVDGNATSAAANRFRLVFKPSGALPVSFISISANRGARGGATVNWKVAAERAVRHYEVERSLNGRTFTTAGAVTATGLSDYSFADGSASTGVLFYRIKMVGIAGDISYSSIVKLNAGSIKPVFSISPNPAEAGIVNLQFINQAAGQYNIRLLSITGQLILGTYASHTGGSSAQVLNLPLSIARGTYQVEIIAPDKTRTVQKLFINTNK